MAVADQTNREKEIFDGALDCAPGEERQRYIDVACGTDAVLLARIQALLEANNAGEDFLPEVPKQKTTVVTEKPGDQIGRYRLLEKIGEGGCGVVYMAEQSEPLRRRVALKIIKLGMDTKSVIARFEAERQALALMDHPNIAKVLDDGATSTGRPYFVMELVHGVKITDYCDQNHLTIRQRLDLFIQVCRAIQHAHQKGVIHRDIKPSNVLVATQDGVAVPKVIDFGIAKATQGKLTEQTVFTAFEQFLGTPAYMSPEQAQLGGMDVDTRSDIYSLGVLLYELLTSKTPFDAKELLADGLEAMRRTIQEKEPPTPSTRLKQDLGAGSDKSALPTPHSPVDKDLDWIVMKCLEKDRARRYETANGLAMDIERHLKNEPVVAGPPSKLYVFRKTVQRNKTAFAAATAVTVVLLLGVMVSTWEAFRATAAERRSNKNGVKSQQVAEFLKEMLASVGPSKARGRDTAMMREILDKTAARIGKDLTNQPEVLIELRDTLATTYRELGLYKETKALAEENLKLARALFGAEDLTVAAALAQLGSAMGHLGDFDEGEHTLREALALRRKLLAKEHSLVAATLAALAAEIVNDNSKLVTDERLAEAEAISREALAMRRKLLGDENLDVARSLTILAALLDKRGKLDEAEAVQREALAMQQKLSGKEHPDVAQSLNNLAYMIQTRGKLQEAEATHREALALQRKLLGNDHPNLVNSLENLALVLLREDKLGEAEATLKEELAIIRKSLGSEHPKLFDVLSHLGQILRQQGKLAEAETLLQESVRSMREHQPAYRLDDGTLALLVDVLVLQEKFKEAEPVAKECLAIREKDFPENPRTFNMKRLLGEALLGQQKYDEAEPVLLAAYEGLKKQDHIQWTKNSVQDIVRLYEATERPDKVAEWKVELTGWNRRLVAQQRKAAESGNPQAINDLAWVLATSADASVRDGAEAVTYAEKAVVATSRKDVGFLDTLAAAYAEAGEFTQAVATEKEALALAGDDPQKKALGERLRLYESNTPYREH
jgi:eukaryotic-like serine/threonine-protein kinase